MICDISIFRRIYMETNAKMPEHGVNIISRRHMDISGVRDVESFDEEGASLLTTCGRLTLEGRGIKVSALDVERGIVKIEGQIDALFYSDVKEDSKRGLFGRMLG